MVENTYEVVRLKGAEIASVFDELSALRITVFRDYPYLYAGNVAYEKEYLQIYSKSERSFVVALYHQGEMIGATTCLPLMEETEELKRPFQENGFDPANIFYFGESIILKVHRGKGFGHLFSTNGKPMPSRSEPTPIPAFAPSTGASRIRSNPPIIGVTMHSGSIEGIRRYLHYMPKWIGPILEKLLLPLNLCYSGSGKSLIRSPGNGFKRAGETKSMWIYYGDEH